MKLAFDPQRQAAGPIARNRFLRGGCAILMPLLLSCRETEAPKAPEPAKQSITGRYCCTPTTQKVSAAREYGIRTVFSIYEEDGRLLIANEFNIPGLFPGTEITEDERGFHYESKSPFGSTKATGAFSGDGTLTYSLIRSAGGSSATFEWKCTKCGATAKTAARKDQFMKAVFIRPAPGELYGGFGQNENKPAVGGGTLYSVARDLLKSGVTDIFLAFKSDGAWTLRHDHNSDGKFVEGHPGDLLYDSRYDASEEHSFAEARKAGFEPIGALMSACRSAYAAAGKKVRFHAWFPAFKDEHAAKLFGAQKAYADRGLVGNVVEAVSDLFKDKKYDCECLFSAEPSNPAAVAYELAVLEEIMAKYPALSGINLDYIRYSIGETCYDEGKASRPLKVSTWIASPAAVEDFVKKVRERFPKVILSADVLATEDIRVRVAQEGMLQSLDIIMPMAYSYDRDGSSEDIKQWVGRIRTMHPTKKLLPILRGYTDGINNPASKGLVADLIADLAAAKTVKIDGYGIFTYEKLLRNTHTTLTELRSIIGY